MLLTLVALGAALYLQVVPPVVPPQQPPPGSGNPIVIPPGGNTTTPGGNTTTQVMSQSVFGDYVVAGTDRVLTRTAEGGFEAIHQFLGIPDWLLNRNRANTIDEDSAAQLNDQLRLAMIGLVPLAVALALFMNVTSVLTGKPISPGLALGGLGFVFFGAFVGWNNRMLLGQVVDLASMLFATIAGADIVAFVTPGLHVANFAAPIIGALLAILYCIVVIALTVVWWIQWAWVVVLGSMMSLGLLAAFTPVAAPFGRQLIKRWGGSLIDPLLMLTALRLAAPFLGTADSAPDAARQLISVAFLIVAWQSPGFFVGAVGGAVPWLAEAYMLSRLTGVGRLFQGGAAAAALGAGPGTGGGATAVAESAGSAVGTAEAGGTRWKAVPWTSTAADGGLGGGNAASNKLGPGQATA